MNFAVEAPFFGKNVQSMLKLGRAQGVSMAAALYRDIPISEYSPRKIKQSITGTGAASKEQVAGMLQSILKIESLPKSLDATDGLAVALCHYYQSTSVVAKSGSKDWSSFIAKNPWASKVNAAAIRSRIDSNSSSASESFGLPKLMSPTWSMGTR